MVLIYLQERFACLRCSECLYCSLWFGLLMSIFNLTKAGAKFQANCVDNGVDYAIYVWIVDQLKKDLDFMGYSPINVDAALMYIPLSIDEVFGGTSLHDRALRLFESQEDYFRKMLID